jgi:hypothetical protein
MVQRSRKRGGRILRMRRSRKSKVKSYNSNNRFQRGLNKNKIPKEYRIENRSNNKSETCKWYEKQFDLLMKENKELKNKVEQQSYDLMYLRDYLSKMKSNNNNIYY